MNNKNSFQKLLSEEQGCLNLEQLEGLLEANREQEPRTVRHVEDCPRCRSELALLRDFQTSELSGEEEQAVDWIIGHLDTSGWSKSPDCSEDQGQQTVMSDRRRSWIPKLLGASWLPAAGFAVAAVLLVTAIGISLLDGPGSPAPDGGTTVVRSAPIRLTGPLGELAEPPVHFSWKADEVAGHHFEVALFEVDKTELWIGKTMELTLAVPDHVSALLSPGRRFLWKVTLRSADGRVVSDSGVRSFSIAGAGQR